MDCSLPGSSIHGVFQARVLEWVAISFSRGSSRFRDQTRVSRIVGRRFTIWATKEATKREKQGLTYHRDSYFEGSPQQEWGSHAGLSETNSKWLLAIDISHWKAIWIDINHLTLFSFNFWQSNSNCRNYPLKKIRNKHQDLGIRMFNWNNHL